MKNIIIKKSKRQGKGVFTNKAFKKGEVILEIDDSHIVVDQKKLTKRNWEFDLDFL